jgi:hypothetical protein
MSILRTPARQMQRKMLSKDVLVIFRQNLLLFFAKTWLQMMRRSLRQQSIKQLASSPTALGGLSRLTADRLRRAGIKLEPLLSRIGLTVDQIDDLEQRIDAGCQIAFLDLAAKALKDDFLGLSLVDVADLRDLECLYYVMGSSDTLGGALHRASRYSQITNEAIVLKYREARYLHFDCLIRASRAILIGTKSNSASLRWSACLASSAVATSCRNACP